MLMLQRSFFSHSPEHDSSLPRWVPGLPSGADPHPIVEYTDPDPESTKGGDKEHGINAYAWEWLAISGPVTRWIHRLRQELTTSCCSSASLLTSIPPPWAAESEYTRFNNLLFETEAKLHPRHLLRNTGPLTKWTTADLEHQRDYWVPWFLMHITSHAIPALLNHPLTHILSLRGGSGGGGRYQSRHFMQQIVDQALFHSGWVSRLVAMLRDSGLRSFDPFVWRLIMAVGTISWLFQFSGDEKVSTRAAEDLNIAKAFLTDFAEHWPHIGRKVCWC